MNATEQKSIAQTIISQINAYGPAFPRVMQLIGAKNMVFLHNESLISQGEFIRGGLMFMLPYKYKIIVELTAMDTYTVSLGKITGVEYRTIQTVEDVYCDMIGEVVYSLATERSF